MSALSGFFKDKISTNAAYGLVLLAGLLALALNSNIRDRVVQAKTDTAYAARELAKLNAIKDGDEWAAREKESAIALEKWQATEWQGETVGVLAATLQQVLIQYVEDLGMENPRINVSNELIDIDGKAIMRFSLSGTTDTHSAPIELLLEMANAKKRIIVDEVITDFFSAERALVRVSGLVIVRIGTASTAQGGVQ